MSLEFYSNSQTQTLYVFRPNILSLAHKNNPKNSTKVDYILFTLICCRGPHTETCRYYVSIQWEMYVNLFSMVPTINWTTLPAFSILWWWNINIWQGHFYGSSENTYSTHILVSLAAIQPRNLSSMRFFLFYFIYFSATVYEKSLGPMCFGGKIRWNLKWVDVYVICQKPKRVKMFGTLLLQPVGWEYNAGEYILTEKQSSQCWRAQCCRWHTRSFVPHCTVTQRCERCSTLGCPRPETELHRWLNCGPTNCTSTA